MGGECGGPTGAQRRREAGAEASVAERLGAGAARRAGPLAGALAAAGGAALLALPVFAREAFLDENALLAGAAAPALGAQHAALGVAAADAAAAALANGADPCGRAMAVAAPWLTLPPRGLDLPGSAAGSAGVAVGGARAPRGDGSEALALVTPVRPGAGGTDALAAAAAVMAALGQAPWLAKDVLWLCVAAPQGEAGAASEGDAVHAWLHEYHRPGGAAAAAERTDLASGQSVPGFLRGGALQLAVALEPPAASAASARGSGALELELEVVGGGRHFDRLPNQDLFNTVVSLARAMDVPLRLAGSPPPPADPQRASVCPPRSLAEYLACLSGLLEFSRKQAAAAASPSSAAPGLHTPFAAFAVDAVTLRGGPGAGAAWDAAAVRRMATLLELTLRSGNNLLEKFHHSSWLYALPATGSFVGPEAYLAAPVLACLALVLQAVSLVLEGPRIARLAAADQRARLAAARRGGGGGVGGRVGWGWGHNLSASGLYGGVLDRARAAGVPCAGGRPLTEHTWVYGKALLLSILSLEIAVALLRSWAAALSLLPAVPACLLLRPMGTLRPARAQALAGAALAGAALWALLHAGPGGDGLAAGALRCLPMFGPVLLGAVAVLAAVVSPRS